MNMKKSVFVLFSLCLALSCDASVWPAVWIGCHAEKSGADLRVAYFRKSAQLNTVPDAHLIRVSADNRYKLFVNGVLVSLGPARSDLSNWNYETVDIAPYLRQGKNPGSRSMELWREASDGTNGNQRDCPIGMCRRSRPGVQHRLELAGADGRILFIARRLCSARLLCGRPR